MSKGKRSESKEIDRETKRGMALERRREGASYRDIAIELGVSISTAHEWVHAALADVTALNQDKATELRELEAERLDHILQKLWPRVNRGNLSAIDRALRVILQRAKLLGLEAPQQHQISGAGGGALKIEWVAPVQPGDDIGEGADELPDAT